MELEDKVYRLKELFNDCVLCPRACRVNRVQGDLGYCRLPAKIIMDCALAHHGEEPPLSGENGAGTIFLSSCNLGCIYCQNYQISHSAFGRELDSAQMAEIMLDLQKRRCHNIELVTPTPQVPLIMEALLLARRRGLKAPFVYNCGGYEDPQIINMLDKMVDVYLPDFKYGLEEDGNLFSSAPGYPRFALSSLKEMVRQVGDDLVLENGIACKGIIVRHLVLPGRLDNSKEVLRLIKKEISTTVPVSLMSQYTPISKGIPFRFQWITRRQGESDEAYCTYVEEADDAANKVSRRKRIGMSQHPALGRRITRYEYDQILDYALHLGFENLFVQEVSDQELTPDFSRDNPFE